MFPPLREALGERQLKDSNSSTTWIWGMFTEPQKSELSNRGRRLNSSHPQAGFGLRDLPDDEDVTKLRRALKPFFRGARRTEILG